MKTIIINGREIKYSIGEKNKELVPNEEIKYMIFNLPRIETCPEATDICKKEC